VRRRPFAGGRAPAAWARAMERAAAGLPALMRACAWVGPLASARPRLLGRGAWDEGLAALAGRAPRAAAPDAAPRVSRRASGHAEPLATPSSSPLAPVRDPRRASSAAADPLPPSPRRPRAPFDGLDDVGRSGAVSIPVPGRSRPASTVSSAGSESSRVPRPPSPDDTRPGRRPVDPLALPRQADPGFLAALATRAAAKANGTAVDRGDAVRRPSSDRTADTATVENGRRRMPIPPLPDRPSIRRPAPAVGSGEEAKRASAEWIDRIAKKAIRRLSEARPDAASDVGALAEEWESPLAAPVVAAGWLAELAGPRAAARSPSGEGRKSSPEPRSTTPPPSDTRTRATAHPPSDRRSTARWTPEAGTMADAPPAGPDAPDFARAGAVRPARLPKLPGVEDGGTRTVSPETPVAVPGAEAVRLPPAPDEGGAGEELGELARRIKTILDDEARRFGIDV
jgi:hypothetical protein